MRLKRALKKVPTLMGHDLKKRYWSKNALPGILKDAAAVLMYLFVFSLCFDVPAITGKNYALWLFAGLVPWLAFRDGFTGAAGAMGEYGRVLTNAGISPPIAIFARALSALVVYLIPFVALIIWTALDGGLSASAPMAVYFLFCAVLTAFAQGLFAGALGLLLPAASDGYALGMFVAFWMAPVAWPIEALPEIWRRMVHMNPLYYVVGGMRQSLFGGTSVLTLPIAVWFYSVTVLTLVAGLLILKRLRLQLPQLISWR